MLSLHVAFGRLTPRLCLGRGLRDRVGPSRARAARRPELEPLDARLLLSAVPTPDHVVFVVEENHSFSQIIGSTNAPYINSLAGQGALFTNSSAIEHPSEPNYLDLFSGSNQGVVGDPNVTQPFATPNLGASLIQAGRTFGGYSQGLPSVGSKAFLSGAYAARHNPWVDWQGASANAIPDTDNLPFSDFPSDFTKLPTVSFVVPDVAHDMHDDPSPTGIQLGDTWLKDNLDSYVQWAQSHNSLLILTFDENDTSPGNQIATIFVGPMVVPGKYAEPINHFSVLRTVEDMYSLPPAGASATATPITDVWQSPATTQLGVSAPSSTAPGVPFTITVTAQDATGSKTPGYTGTVHFTSSDAQAGLPADYTFTAADAGVHTFTNGATLKTAGPQTITATDKATPSLTGTRSGITVAPAATSRLVLGAPSSTTAGAAFSVTVTAQDATGKTAPGYTGTVHFTSSDAQAGLPADYTFTAADAGVHTFTNGATLKAAGPQTITATDDKATPGFTGTPASIAVAPAAASRLDISGPTTVNTGAASSITVTAFDPYGNRATGYVGTVHFAGPNTRGLKGKAKGKVVLPGDYTFTAGDAGMHIFTNAVIFKTTGSQSVTVADTASPGNTATLAGIRVVKLKRRRR